MQNKINWIKPENHMGKIKRNFFEITVKAVIINDKNEILLAKRSENGFFGVGKYDLPGGKLEEGEDIKKGLKREIKEETGIEVEIGPVLYVFDFEKKYNKKYEIGEEEILISGKGLRFLAYYKSGEVALSREHEKYEWVGIDEAFKKFGDDDFEKDKKVSIKKTKEYLELSGSLDGWKRCRADFENYKKRLLEEKKDMIAYSNINLISQVLPVLDNFHASTEHIPENQKESVWVAGIMHIQKQLEKVLEDNGIEEIEAKIGDSFDPGIHEAIEGRADKASENKTEEEIEGKIKKIVQKGYKIGERVVRPVRVIAG